MRLIKNCFQVNALLVDASKSLRFRVFQLNDDVILNFILKFVYHFIVASYINKHVRH